MDNRDEAIINKAKQIYYAYQAARLGSVPTVGDLAASVEGLLKVIGRLKDEIKDLNLQHLADMSRDED